MFFLKKKKNVLPNEFLGAYLNTHIFASLHDFSLTHLVD